MKEKSPNEKKEKKTANLAVSKRIQTAEGKMRSQKQAQASKKEMKKSA